MCSFAPSASLAMATNTAIGVPREDAANALLEYLRDEEIRVMIGMEIRSMLMDEDALPPSVRDATIEQLLRERIEAQNELDACRRGEWSRSSNARREVPLIEIAIAEWCVSVAVCERFVESYIRNKEGRGGYLQTAVREVGGPASTSLDALAKIFDFQACVWQRDDDSRVKCIGRVNGGDAARQMIHMLHDGRVHFDRLVAM